MIDDESWPVGVGDVSRCKAIFGPAMAPVIGLAAFLLIQPVQLPFRQHAVGPGLFSFDESVVERSGLSVGSGHGIAIFAVPVEELPWVEIIFFFRHHDVSWCPDLIWNVLGTGVEDSKRTIFIKLNEDWKHNCLSQKLKLKWRFLWNFGLVSRLNPFRTNAPVGCKLPTATDAGGRQSGRQGGNFLSKILTVLAKGAPRNICWELF